MSGFDLLKELKVRFPTVRMLVLSMHDETYYAERCIRAGAAGFIMKQEASDQIVQAIRRVAEGKLYLSDVMSGSPDFTARSTCGLRGRSAVAKQAISPMPPVMMGRRV